jgi:acid phosphatase
MQTSVEYRANSLQAFRSARLSLDRALKNRQWTAALEQQGKFKKLPPAVIADADETLLDNSPAHARFLLDGDGNFEAKQWTAWTQEKKARALPGAAAFAQYAASRGVTMFYVTNREKEEEAATLDNLRAQGFPVVEFAAGSPGARAGLPHNLLLRLVRPDWPSDKSTRRKLLAEHYRILLLVGDDLGDFLPGARTTAEARDKLSAAHESWWGERWIVLPNAMYGSWENALTGGAQAAAALEKKRAALRRE